MVWSPKYNVVYAGAIRPANNVGNILDAAALLEDDNDIQFLIYGDGSEKEVLEKRIVDEGLSNVKMKGFINKQFIPYILSKSSVGNLINGLVYQIFQPFIDFIGLVPSADTVLIHFLLLPWRPVIKPQFPDITSMPSGQ